jgi:hypothetical protein
MAGKNSGGKGNPAHTRMMNARLQQRRQECWNRGQARKRANAAANEAAHKKNLALKAEGKLTPHEEQRLLRRERRNVLRLQGLIPPIGMDRVEWNKQQKKAYGGQS